MLSGKGDWIPDLDGCTEPIRVDDNFVTYNCNHLSLFGILVVNNGMNQQITYYDLNFVQNTRPASCLNGQKQNIDRTGCIGKTLAILPFFFIYSTSFSYSTTY